MNLNSKYPFSLLCAATIATTALYYGCSTEKTGFAHRAYHNTTSHYNGYFNARESYREGVAQIEAGYQEDYTKVLSVFIYGDESTSKSVYPQMDRAIEKCGKVIQRHSIYKKKKEYVNWIDDCWFLIGQSYFYKHDYVKAREMFEYVARQYKEEEIRFHAMLWLARTETQREDLTKSSRILDLMNENPDFPNKLKGQHAEIYADNYIRQHNYTLAIPEMKTAISMEKKRKRRVRMLYILAQLYHEESNFEMASNYYLQVTKLRPPYEMEFYAKINRAMAYNVGAGNSDEIKKELEKMLRDEKNVDYYDQIYYALADIYLKEGEQAEAIDLLEKSITSSISNDNIKGKACLKLADIYFGSEPPSYELAQAYYDSTVLFIDKSRIDFQTILNKRNSLTRLVRDITTVQRQDSLQEVAQMPKAERDALIEEVIEKVIEEEERMKEEMEQGTFFNDNNLSQNQNVGSGANWYFYNPGTISFGFSEFRRLWGDRKLEDNWRRKDKSSFVLEEMESFDDLEELAAEDTIEGAKDNKNPNYYLKNLPLTEEKMNRSHNKIIEALYDLGLVYKEQLDDNFMATETFKELIQRYDTCRYTTSCYYQLYRMYLADENEEEANYYRNLILTKHPDSEYAQLLKNPNYFKEREASKTEVVDYYKGAYKAYKKKYWTKTINQCNAADSLYPQSDLAPKFHFLRALAIGHSTARDTFVMELKKVAALHPDDEVAEECKRMVAILTKDTRESSNDQKEEVKYAFDPKSRHSFVLLVPNKGVNMNDLKTTVSDFNMKYFRMDKLKVVGSFLEQGKTQMLSVKEFADKDKAMDYLKTLKENSDVLQHNKSDEFSVFAISYPNMALLFQSKDVDKYLTFFEDNYLKEIN